MVWWVPLRALNVLVAQNSRKEEQFIKSRVDLVLKVIMQEKVVRNVKFVHAAHIRMNRGKVNVLTAHQDRRVCKVLRSVLLVQQALEIFFMEAQAASPVLQGLIRMKLVQLNVIIVHREV